MIQFINLHKSFAEKKVLRGINLQIHEGEILFILGISGTGKSVLLKNVVGLLKPDAGEIIIEGENITMYSEEQMLPIRKKCGLVFQHPALFDSLSVFDNIAYGLRKHFRMNDDEIKNRVIESLHHVDLGNDILYRSTTSLSFGMQKRVSLARTIALKPKILLFDEPTTGLDPVTTNAINFLIQKLSRELKTTSIVVSHDMQCALSIAHRIIVLDQGQIIEQGTPEDLKKSKVHLVKEFLEEALSEARQ